MNFEIIEETGRIDKVISQLTDASRSKIQKSIKDHKVQVNGKVRATITISVDEDEESIKEKALSAENVKRHTDGKEIVKVIVIKGKIVNIVVK